MVDFVGHNFKRNHKYGKVPFKEILTASLQSPQLLTCANYRYTLHYTLSQRACSLMRSGGGGDGILLAAEVAVCVQGQVEVPFFLAADLSILQINLPMHCE